MVLKCVYKANRLWYNIHMLQHIAIIIIVGFLGVALLVGHAILNPLDSLAEFPVWAWPVGLFMFIAPLLDKKES